MQVVSEALDVPEKFIKYIYQRQRARESERILAIDEIDYLGKFLEEDLEIPVPEKEDTAGFIPDHSHEVASEIGYEFGP